MKKPTKTGFTARTNALLNKLGLTQKPLAKKLGISVASFYGYRVGTWPVAERVWEKLRELENETPEKVPGAETPTFTKPEKPVSARSGRQLILVNNKGEVLHLSADATMGDLVRLGITSFGISQKGAALPDGWFRDTSTPTIRLPGQK